MTRDRPHGPLAQLVDHVARHAASQEERRTADLDYFKNTWARLSANRRLTQSLSRVPENAGPLNSHHLVHRSLSLMRELSPEYLQQFVSYVDALMWLEQVNGGSGAGAADSPRAERRGKATRNSAG